jgi:hypothetical protein
VRGDTDSTDFPTTSEAYDTSFNGGSYDVFVSKLDGNLSASSKPTVTTGTATNVTSNSATLNGTVNANGLSTTAWFNYGITSGSYTGTSTTQSVSGSSDTSVSIYVSGLSSGTGYYYRLVAQNNAGVSYGSENSFTTITSSTPVPTPTPTSNNGLVAYYPFNGNANDESGNGNNGTVNGATLTTDRSGVVNSALSFDGVNDYVRVEDSLSLDIAGAITIAAWVKINSISDYWGIVSKRINWIDCNYQVYFAQDGSNNWMNPRFTFYNGGWPTHIATNAHLFVDTWYYVAVTFNENTDEIKMYDNGDEVYSGTETLTMSTNNAPLYLGWETGVEYFDGSMDEVAIFVAKSEYDS